MRPARRTCVLGGVCPGLEWLELFVPWDVRMQWAPLPAALERLGDDAPDSVHALTIDQLVEGIWKPFICTWTSPGTSQTLLHGDPHIGNTYLVPTGEVGFLDWQVARHGNSRSILAISCRAR